MSLNQVTLRNGSGAVYESPIGNSDYAATVNTDGVTVTNTYYGLYPAITNVKDSTFTDNYYAVYPYEATVDHSTFTNNYYAVEVVSNEDGSLPGDATVTNSTLDGGAGGVDSDYTDVYADNIATVTSSTVTRAYYGIDADYANVSGSTINGNYLGVNVYFATVSDSTISQNESGIDIYADDDFIGDANVSNSTIRDNQCGILAEISSEGDTVYRSTAEASGSWFDANGYGIYAGFYPCPTVSGVSVQATSSEKAAPGSRSSQGPKGKNGANSQASAMSLSKQTVKPTSLDSMPNTITVTGSAFTNTQSDAINAAGATVIVSDTTMSGGGGGIYAGTANVVNSTISGNVDGIVANQSVTIALSTIADNDNAGLAFDMEDAHLTITGVILSANGLNCAAISAVSYTTTDDGGNLSTDDTCKLTAATSATNVSPTDLQLGSLADNNGPEVGLPSDQTTLRTMALGNGSIAIDRLGVNEVGQCVDVSGQVITDPITGNPITTDERGVTRPQGPGCDSGAYEVNGLQVVTAPGSTAVVRQGFYALLRISVEDASGTNISRRALPVSSVELDGPNGQVIPFSHQFQFGRFSGAKGYQLAINTRNLAKGDWTVVLQIGSGNDASSGSVTFTVE